MKKYAISETEANQLLAKNAWTSVVIGHANLIKTINLIKSNARQLLEDFEFEFQSSTLSSIRIDGVSLYLQIKPKHKVKYLCSHKLPKAEFGIVEKSMELIVSSCFDLNTPIELMVQTNDGELSVWDYLESKKGLTSFINQQELAVLIS